MNRFLLLFLLLLFPHAISVGLLVAARGRQDSDPSGEGGKTLQRFKRGWMWNHFFLLEEYTGNDYQYVGKLHSDMDKGDGTVKYVLSGEGAGSLFLIDENSGDLHATKRLDREEKAFYTLRAQAVDKKTGWPLEPETEFIVKIHDINDNEPKFTKPMYTASVPEMSEVGTFVARVTATDADDATYGNSAKLVYSILQGQPYFSVEPESGIIRTALSSMNRKNKEKYQVVIQAKDMAGQTGGLSGTTTVNITLTDVNDSPPRFPHSSYHLSTLESAEIGSAVGRIKANDGDVGENAEIQYRIIDGDTGDMFDIVTDKVTQEGIVSVRKLLDYESRRTYTLKVEAANTNLDYRFTHLGPFKDTATVKITVQDVEEPPVFGTAPYVIEVHEDTTAGSVIGVVTAWDPDATDHPVRYSIDRHTDLERLFHIDSVNGSISTLKSLDREMSKWHNISVVATEISNPQQISRVPVFIKVLDVNDNAPEFAMFYETFVCENVKAGQLIQTISAVDTDEPLIGHKFVFALSTTNPNFTILDNEDNTARILTRRGGFSRREMSAYLLRIVISDNDYPVQSSTNTLTVRVCACDGGGNVRTCSLEALLLSAGLSTGALVAILLCIVILLMIVVLFAALRRQRKKEPLIFSKDDVRDNIVSYNDEGGGEEDTQAFDIGTLRHPEVMDATSLRRDIIPEVLFPLRRTSIIEENPDVRDFINSRLQDNDSDPTAPPYDSLATYAYEGSGSIAESLSSLESAATDADHEYDYLSNWGPQFKKLADMYIGKNTGKDV
ncbi:cadherin-10-like isoform X1 [Brienomyrus brachyistius]|uniref:cadherin-10-like isoform X1 n=1 Tax=Brienomyrus brachyistius TaxID=42636 RepID=UPI0020B36687|nr:cadherin-10-like isoform X1 [Brienomyrus brachyistius]XP_048867097.1 cadherin-10-like isoform X1 [Brienomyrus brachyistius]XP_048867098.1 cadherin-10-like isoform X1 [Brienomyrus brachyistius]